MKRMKMELVGAMVLGILLFGGKDAFAQDQSSQQTAPAQGGTDKAPAPITTTPLTLNPAPPPVTAEEEAAMRAFRDAPMTDVPKKNQMGEDLVQKYPQSRYRVEVYSWLVKGYLGIGQVDKMEVAGEKELAIQPDDATTLAIMGSVLPRVMNASTPEPMKRLAKAEQYSKRALELIPALQKPAGLTDEQFTAAKNQTSAMAYSGLGLVAFRRGKYDDAIPNLEQSVKLDPNPDPVNYYLLGISNEKASHLDDATAAFTKCANIPGGMETTCKAGIEEVKKLATTQLNVPR